MNTIPPHTPRSHVHGESTRKHRIRSLIALMGVAAGLACAGGPVPEGTPEAEQTTETPTRTTTQDAPGPESRHWEYDENRGNAIGVDRLDAHFDQFITPCTLRHEGTGGIGRTWHPDDDCGLGPEGFLMKGQWTSICFGASPGQHPPWCDPEDASENETVNRLIPVTIESGCSALFGEHPFTQVQGCRD